MTLCCEKRFSAVCWSESKEKSYLKHILDQNQYDSTPWATPQDHTDLRTATYIWSHVTYTYGDMRGMWEKPCMFKWKARPPIEVEVTDTNYLVYHAALSSIFRKNQDQFTHPQGRLHLSAHFNGNRKSWDSLLTIVHLRSLFRTSEWWKPPWRIRWRSPTKFPRTEEKTWMSSETFWSNKKEHRV